MSRLDVRLERWVDCSVEAIALAAEHWDEVETGVEPRRKFAPDVELIARAELAGMFKIIVGRVDGLLVSYFTWNIMLDAESQGLLIGTQGAWFVAPWASVSCIGHRMFKASVEMLRGLGVKMIFPHHRLQGRGADIGHYFINVWHAKPIQTTYALWIGE